METRAVVYKAQFGPRFRVCRDCFDSLSDGRSYERCEGAGKTAPRWDASSRTTEIEFVQWDLSCSELQEIQKQASLTLFIWPL